jgi:Lsr2
VRFGIGGAAYEIDLSASNAAAFRRQLAPFIAHTRKAGRGPRRGPGRTTSGRERSADIRAWAKDQGIAVSEPGRIPASIVTQYEAAPAPDEPARRAELIARLAPHLRVHSGGKVAWEHD